MQTSLQYMSLALQLAERGRLTVSPNPMVGCVIVNNQQMVAQGYHKRAGKSHAEIYALQAAGPLAKGASLYITLEPCCHHGRTPPCTDALIQAGIQKVYVATLDPNPLVAGKGVARLREAGIEVEIGLLEEEAIQLNEIFFHYITHRKPFVIAKWAMSLDGKTITHPDDDRKISGTTSHANAHILRSQVDAILIGAETARKDNPLLTVRLDNETPEKQPVRIILSSTGKLPENLNMLAMPGKTILAITNKVDTQPLIHYKNIELMILPANEKDQVNLNDLLIELGKREIRSLLVEGGTTLHERFFAEGLVNKVKVYVAPVIIGSMKKKLTLNELTMMPSDKDWSFEGSV